MMRSAPEAFGLDRTDTPAEGGRPHAASHPVASRPSTRGGGGSASTAAVLWLMITLVFLPIAGAHGLARLWEHEGGEHHAALAGPEKP